MGEKIYSAILNVMNAIQHLQKDDNVSFGKGSYKAISEEKVTSTVRVEMARNNLVMFPIETQYVRTGNIGQLHVKYRMVCTDDGSSIEIASVGEGSDTQDKASGKAMTYAFKYALLRTFMIPTGEDPDKISSAELDHKQAEEAVKQAKAAEEPITSQQVGEIKISAGVFGEMRGKTMEEVIKAAGVMDITKLTKEQGDMVLQKINNWVKKAQEEAEKAGA